MHFRTVVENESSGSFTVTLPPDTVDKLGIVGGETVVINVDDDKIVLRRATDLIQVIEE